MAKVPFTKLKLKTNEDFIPLQIGDETIAVKQYLPIQEKLSLISRVVEYAHMQDNNYSNPVKADAIRDLEIVFAYTNLTFTDKQKEDLAKLYDMLYSSGVLMEIIRAIPEDEYNVICSGVWRSIDAVYNYLNSAVGILDSITKSQENAVVNLDTIQDGLKALENNSLLKEIAPLLGLE